MSTHVDRTDLERDLRAAASAVPDRVLPDGAWQENQRRLAADRRTAHRRGGRPVAIAAGFVAVLVLGGLLLGGGLGSRGGMPAGGGDDPFRTEYLLGPPVEVETLQLGGVSTVHEAALSDQTGQGPNLCDRYVAGTSSAGGCTGRQPGADKPSVAFDWLTGTSGSGDIRGVLAGVDSRVAKVSVWTVDGDRTSLPLLPSGWQDTKILGVTVAADSPRPQRLVAYDRTGRVLQGVDLSATFGSGWLPRVNACRTTGGLGSWPQPGTAAAADVRITWGSTDALVTAGTGTPVCLEPLRPAALAGWTVAGDRVVVAVAPEVAVVQLVVRGEVVARTEPSTSAGSPMRAAVFRGLGTSVLRDALLVALDGTRHELGRAYVREPASP